MTTMLSGSVPAITQVISQRLAGRQLENCPFKNRKGVKRKCPNGTDKKIGLNDLGKTNSQLLAAVRRQDVISQLIDTDNNPILDPFALLARMKKSLQAGGSPGDKPQQEAHSFIRRLVSNGAISLTDGKLVRNIGFLPADLRELILENWGSERSLGKVIQPDVPCPITTKRGF